MQHPSSMNPCSDGKFIYKNRLQEHAQRSGIALPQYRTINEGSPHAPEFRSSVVVDGASFRSPRTFSQRKEAEQDAARVAFEELSQKIEQEGCPSISSDTTFCKSILYEYAVKTNLEPPAYNCSLSEGIIPVFVSTVVFAGSEYKGTIGRTKKEAQQLAARAAIEFILGNGDSAQRFLMSQIIRSKGKLYATLSQAHEEPSPPKDGQREGHVSECAQIAPDALVKEGFSGLTHCSKVNPLTDNVERSKEDRKRDKKLKLKKSKREITRKVRKRIVMMGSK